MEREPQVRGAECGGLAWALRNEIDELESNVRSDAAAVGLEVSDVGPAANHPRDFVEAMSRGYLAVLNGRFDEGYAEYERAEVAARKRGNKFEEWVALAGAFDAASGRRNKDREFGAVSSQHEALPALEMRS